MLPPSVLEHLGPADVERVERAFAHPNPTLARELADVVRRGAERQASSEQVALAVGVVLTLAGRTGGPEPA